jgi:NitT/TauT family transport system permease protein
MQAETTTLAPPASLDAAPRKRNTRGRLWTVRLAVVIVWLGSWELAATHWFDPFFYS